MDQQQQTIQHWNQVASLYEEKFMHLDLYNDTYDLFCEWIEKKHPSILEIGCGPGNITRYLATKRPDFKIEATDAAESMINLARKNVPSAQFSVMDCRDISRLTAKFDGIICGFVLPYLSKEEAIRLINDTFKLLQDKGVLYLSVIEDDYSRSRIEKSSNEAYATFVYYHQADYLNEALKAVGFEGLQLIRKTYKKNEQETSVHLILMARKGIPL